MLKVGKILRQTFSTNYIFLQNFCTSVSFYEKFRDFRNVALEELHIEGVTIVNTKEKAQKAVKILQDLGDRFILD